MSSDCNCMDSVHIESLNIKINLILLALGLVAGFATLHRALGRFWKRTEWMSGQFLSYVPHPRDSRFKYPYETPDASYPPHVASCPQFIRSIFPFLRTRISAGFSIGQMIILVVYFLVLLVPAFYKSSGPFNNPERFGWLAASQLPFVFLFAMKNGNVFAAMWGKGCEKLNYLHRFIGKVIVIVINIHAIGYFYKWSILMEFRENIANPRVVSGIVGLVCANGLYFLSTPWWRTNAYRFFVLSHIIFVCALIGAICCHLPALIPWMGVCMGIYALDHFLRLMKTRRCVALISPVPSISMTRIECHGINSGWRAGQHVRVRVLSTGMGIFGCFESYPFMVSSAGGGEGLVLLCKKTGPWTNRLYNLASRDGQPGESQVGLGKDVKILIDGPYGGPGHTMIASFSAALFVCGGRGISFGIAAIEELIMKEALGESRVKVIELIWMLPDPSSLNVFLPQFSAMIEKSIIPVRISVFYTCAHAEKAYVPGQIFPLGLSLSAGRPKMVHVLEAVIVKALKTVLKGEVPQKTAGVLVGVCGPVSLVDDMNKDVGAIDASLRDEMGGVELYEEAFEW